MKKQLAIGVVLAGVSGPAHAQVFETTTCDPDLVDHLKSILGDADVHEGDFPGPLGCLDLSVDLSIVYDEGDFPLLTCEETPGEVALTLVDPDAVLAVKQILAAAAIAPPPSTKLRLNVGTAIVYDEDDFPDHCPVPLPF